MSAGGRPAMEAKRQIHVLSVKQQLDECTAAIMNPIEGEQEAGGRPFRAGQKAISLVPSLFVCGGACMMHTHSPTRRKGDQSEDWNGVRR